MGKITEKILGKISDYIARKIAEKIAREKKQKKLVDNPTKNCKSKKAGKIAEKL